MKAEPLSGPIYLGFRSVAELLILHGGLPQHFVTGSDRAADEPAVLMRAGNGLEAFNKGGRSGGRFCLSYLEREFVSQADCGEGCCEEQQFDLGERQGLQKR